MATISSANVGRAVAARVGANIREVRTQQKKTQTWLAKPEFSISYVSAVERGKIRPSLRALSILARRLGVSLTFLLDGSPAGAAEARAVGYSPAGAGPDPRVEVELLHAAILLRRGDWTQAAELLAPLSPERLTTYQAYQVYLLSGLRQMGEGQYQEATGTLRTAVSQGEGINDSEAAARARNLLGQAYYALCDYPLALQNHRLCLTVLEGGQIPDPLFRLEVLGNLAQDYFSLDDTKNAAAYARQALEMAEGLSRDSRSYAQHYMQVSLSYKQSGRLARARHYAMRSLAIYEMRDQQHLVGLTHLQLGKALERQGQPEEAEGQYQEAIRIECELEDGPALSRCYLALAELLRQRGDLQAAEREAGQALAFAQRSEDVLAQGQAHITLAHIQHQGGDLAGADQLFATGLDLIEQRQAHGAAANAYFLYSTLLEKRQELLRSLHHIKKAYEHQRQESGIPAA